MLDGASSMTARSAAIPQTSSPQMIGPHHQYPDGAVLFLGTMFAPVKDRDAPGRASRIIAGDVVTIAADKLGALVERGDDERQGAGVDLRRRRPDAQSGEARVAVRLASFPLSACGRGSP